MKGVDTVSEPQKNKETNVRSSGTISERTAGFGRSRNLRVEFQETLLFPLESIKIKALTVCAECATSAPCCSKLPPEIRSLYTSGRIMSERGNTSDEGCGRVNVIKTI